MSQMVRSFVLLTYEVSMIFHNYLTNPIRTKIAVVAGQPIPFPGTRQLCPLWLPGWITEVEICSLHPLDPVKVAAVMANGTWKERRGLELANSILAQRHIASAKRPGGDKLSLLGNETQEEEEGEDPMSNAFLNLGPDASNFFITCLEQEVRLPCTKRVEVEVDEAFGKCFLFTKLKPQLKTGIGLVLLLDAGPRPTNASLPTEDGIVVRVEHSNVAASKRKLLVQLRTYTRIVLKATSYRLLNTEIQTNGELETCTRDMPRQFVRTPYSDSTCREECRHRDLFQACGCIVSYPRSQMTEEAKRTLPCARAPEKQTCVDDWLGTERESECQKGCLPRCEFWEYAASVSSARFPSKALQEKGRFGDLDIDWYEMRDRLVLLEIVFEDLTFDEVNQESSQTPDGFISQIGGQLGLWIGASVLSLAQAIVIAIAHCCKRLDPQRKDGAKVNVAPPPEAWRRDSSPKVEKTSERAK